MKRVEKAKLKRQNRIRKIKILKKIALFGGLSILVASTLNQGTYATFNDKAGSKAVVASSKTEDIIQEIEIQCYKDKCNPSRPTIEDDVYINPMSIKLKKADNLDFNPVIYFSVEGKETEEGGKINQILDINNYIMNINPVKLESGEVIVPIKLKLSSCELFQLLLECKDYPLEGKIVVKYLNEYINVDKKIKFSKDYLALNYILEVGGINDFNKLVNKSNLTVMEKEIINSTAPKYKQELDELESKNEQLKNEYSKLQSEYSKVQKKQSLNKAEDKSAPQSKK